MLCLLLVRKILSHKHQEFKIQYIQLTCINEDWSQTKNFPLCSAADIMKFKFFLKIQNSPQDDLEKKRILFIKCFYAPDQELEPLQTTILIMNHNHVYLI